MLFLFVPPFVVFFSFYFYFDSFEMVACLLVSALALALQRGESRHGGQRVHIERAIKLCYLSA
jgi:hypothetical protein